MTTPNPAYVTADVFDSCSARNGWNSQPQRCTLPLGHEQWLAPNGVTYDHGQPETGDGWMASQGPKPLSTTTRLYGRGGRVAHLVRDFDNAWGGMRSSICGFAPRPWNGWYGTGSQDEYDRADALPTCKHCQRASEQVARDRS